MNRSSLRRIVAFAALAGLALAGLGLSSVRADEPISFTSVELLFRKHCYACHGMEKPKGDFRIDKLDPDFAKDGDGGWLAVKERLEFGDMPPEMEPPLSKEDRALISAWISQRQAALPNHQATTFRRLTRREYERSMQDLLGIPIEFSAKLPEDGKSKDGFRNDGNVLRMSPLQYETFLQIADEALAEAIVVGPPPVAHRYRIHIHEFRVEPLPKPADRPCESFDFANHPFDITNMGIAPLPPPGGGERPKLPENPYPPNVLPPSAIVRFREAAVKPPKNCVALRMHQAFRSGETLIRIHAARLEPKTKDEDVRVPLLTVAVGSSNFHGVELKTVGEPIAINHTDLQTYEIRVRMENVSVPNTSPLNNRNATILAAWNSARMIDGESEPPLLKIEWIEIEAPFIETWPPKTHTEILFERKGQDEEAYAREVIRRFATRAYRGPMDPSELERIVGLWKQSRENADSLEASMRETLAVVLCSPRFLGLPAARTRGASNQISDYELASRLSYFLWSTMPDETLLQLAEKGKLHEPLELSAQVRRMIQDKRAWAFIEQFTEQWLELDRLQRVVVHADSYPGFDDQLAAAMRLETIHFLGTVLRGDMSIFQFIDSDFTCVNDILAAHYGIAGINDSKFRVVKLYEDHHRGGILTHAGILTGLSDGRDGHPIKRGVWLLRNLLDDPPPPPPPNVPELDREQTKLKDLTIAQALELHRDSPSCLGCHRKIDPWGIAFEEYDAVGNWQRTGRGATLRERRTQQPIQSTTELPNGSKVSGLNELRAELIRTQADNFRRAMAHKVMAYALGRALSVNDKTAADALVPALQAREDRLSGLIELIVDSELFQSK